jgi:dihydrofolate reductase
MTGAPFLSLIAAMDRNRLIGAGNALPWRLPADLQRFRRITLGKPVLMGRRTWESIGRPLPGRDNLVVSRRPGFRPVGVRVFPSVEAALEAAAAADEVVCIGGAALYAELLPRADRMYLTLIDHVFEGDAWFPLYDRAGWVEKAREDHEPDARNPYGFSFLVLDRKRSAGTG